MKKKLIIILVLSIIIFFLVYKLTSKPEQAKENYLKDNKEYNDIDSNNIVSIEVNKYSEAGVDSNLIIDKNEIKKMYNRLSNIKYGEETDMACDDNSTIYTINFNDDSKKKIEIECDWIIIGKKRYMIVK